MMSWPDNIHLRVFMNTNWNWRCALVNEPMLGPRDWSPKIKKALQNLKAKEALVPQENLLTKEEAALCPPLIGDAVLEGTAFVIKIRNTHEVIFVGPQGHIRMSGWLIPVFEGYWGSVEKGLATAWPGDQS